MESEPATPPTPGDAFRRRLTEARKALGLTQRQLVERLGAAGMPMNQAAVARIESGTRKVSLDEAIAIAAVLDIAPVHMFLPIAGDQRGKSGRHGPPVHLAPAMPVDQVKARRWSRGQLPLRPESFWTYLDQSPGDITVSGEELSPEQQAEIREKHLATLRQLGIKVNAEDLPEGSGPPSFTPEIARMADDYQELAGQPPATNADKEDGR